MADGNIIVHGRVITGLEAGDMSLEAASGAGHIVTRCPRCGHRESTDTAWWRRSKGDRESSLGVLSRRLRCMCGSKEVCLEVWPVTLGIEDHPRTYQWRA